MPGPPIRKPSDHSPPAGSPRNIAGHHVLHRPLMPRHPPNAQKNKQQNTRQNQENCRRNLTVRCSRPLYSSQPTHPHPPPPLQQTEKQKKRARQPGRTAPEPRQHATPNKRGHPPQQTTTTTTAPAAHHSGRVSYASTRQPTPPQHPPHRQDTRAPASHPAFRGQQPPGRPGPTNGPDKIKRPGSHPHTTYP